MKKQDVVREYRSGAHKSFEMGEAFVLQGWCQSYELWEQSGMSQADYAQLLDDEGLNRKASVKQNFSHLSWALSQVADDEGCDADELSVLSVMDRWKTMGAIRSERYPENNNNNKKQAVPAKSKKFDAKVRAREFTVQQLLAMLAVKGVK